MKLTFTLLLFNISITIISFIPSQVSAQSSELIINEVLVNPSGPDAGKEWVELINVSSDEITYSNLKIQNISNSGTVRNFNIENNIKLLPNEIILIDVFAYSSELEVPYFINLSLFNSGGQILLLDDNDQILDRVEYNSGASGKSLERSGPLCPILVQHMILDTKGQENSNLDSSCWSVIEDDQEITKILFSVDETNYQPQISVLGGEEIFIDYEINFNESLIVDEKYFLEGGQEIDKAFELNNFQGWVRLQLILEDESIVEKISQKINIYPVLELSEIFSSDNESWIEIHNPNDFDVNLQEYFLLNNSSIINAEDVNTDFICNLSNQISSFEYCLIYTDSSLELNEIELMVDDLRVEEVSFIETQGESLSKINGEWVFSANITPGEENKIQNPEDIIITEILANPVSGEEEWIEIYNLGDFKSDLEGWYFSEELEDYFCKVNAKKIETEILSDSYIVITQSSLGVTLNNSGDIIYLCNSNNEVIDKVEYSNSEKEYSYSREISDGLYIDDFQFTQFQTPNSLNQFPVSQSISRLNIAEVKQQNLDDVILTSGYITSSPNSLGEGILYIQDNTGGIKIDFDGEINPQAGEFVEIEGELKESRNELKISVEDSSLLTEVTPPNYQVNESEVLSLNEDLEGMLVKIEGEIENNYSSSFDIKTEDELVRISLLSSTGIEVQKSKGDKVIVTGIVSQYDDLYRVLPRSNQDIKITKSNSSESSSTNQSDREPDSDLAAYTKPSTIQTGANSNIIQDYRYPIMSTPVRDTSSKTLVWLVFLSSFLLSFTYLLILLKLPRRLIKSYKNIKSNLDFDNQIQYFSTSKLKS